MVNDKFGKDNFDEDKAKILSTSFTSKDPNRADYLNFGTKKAFYLLRNAFAQVNIF